MRILVTGSSGMLGKDVATLFSKDNANEVYGISRTGSVDGISNIKADLTHAQSLKKQLDFIQPELIIHCAASVNVDACEGNRAQADLLHVESTRLLATYSEHPRLVYISTDSVFDGEKGNYTEQDDAQPLNYYAQSKWKGEAAALSNRQALVLRTNIYGFHKPTKTGSLVEWAFCQLSEGKSINGFHDVFFNPLYTVQLADVIAELVQKQSKGIIHAGADRFVSKYDFLITIADTFGFDRGLVKSVSVNDMTFKAKRPKDTTLNTTLLAQQLGHAVPDFDSGMKQLKQDFKQVIER